MHLPQPPYRQHHPLVHPRDPHLTTPTVRQRDPPAPAMNSRDPNVLPHDPPVPAINAHSCDPTPETDSSYCTLLL